MRAPVVAVLALCSTANAQHRSEVIHPPVAVRNAVVAVRTMSDSTRHDGEAFATAWFDAGFDAQANRDQVELKSSVRALGLGNQSEAALDAVLDAAYPVYLGWDMLGPGHLTISGPGIETSIVNVDHTTRPHWPIELMPAGSYSFALHQTLASGEWSGSRDPFITVYAFVVPEPTGLQLAVGVVVFFVAWALGYRLYQRYVK